MNKIVILFAPVIFSSFAQIFIKNAGLHEVKSVHWFVYVALSIASYVIAYVLYSITVRIFPISIASPVNTLSVMIFVVLTGIGYFNEVFSGTKLVGLIFGVLSIILLCYEK